MGLLTSILKMEAASSSELLISIYIITHHCKPGSWPKLLQPCKPQISWG